MKSRKNWILLAVVVLLWGLNWSNMKVGLGYSTPMNYLFQRLLFSSIMMIPFLLITKDGISKDRKTKENLVIQSVIWSLSMIFMMLGLESESSGIGAIVTFTQPLFVFGLSAIFLKNEVTKLRVIGVLMGFGGISMIYLEKPDLLGGTMLSMVFLVLGAFLWAASIVYYKAISDRVHPYLVSLSQAVIGTFVVMPFTFAIGGFKIVLELPFIVSMVYVTLFSTVIGFILWFYLIKSEDATTVSSSSLMIPVVALFGGTLLLGENIGFLQMIGVIMVLAGIYIVNR